MVGRKVESKVMKDLLIKESPHILMLTGRRRVGKTYLIEQVYKNEIVFSFTGTEDAELDNQLAKFSNRLNFFYGKTTVNKKQDWAAALLDLTIYLTKKVKSRKKQVVFFDEFPWINSDKSNFLKEFAYWWNEYASKMNVLVVITGSDTTWMIKKVLEDKSGLHNRVTRRMHLMPFTLAETREFIHKINPRLTNYDITRLYMSFGGIPLYLDQIQVGESVDQSINRICFRASGLLKNEFNSLYASLFENYQNHIAVIRALASKWQGLSRTELVRLTKISDGGSFTKVLKELQSCNFIEAYNPLNNAKKGTLYRLIDEYSRFYIHFIEAGNIKNFQTYAATSKIFSTWQGYTFEIICIKHIEAVKLALGINGVDTSIYSFYKPKQGNTKAFQVDALLDRGDNVINLCEVKFYNKKVTLEKKLIDAIQLKRANFIEYSCTQKTVLNTLITTYGTDRRNGVYSEIDSEISLDQLFLQKSF
jgi:uncharacterized protein